MKTYAVLPSIFLFICLAVSPAFAVTVEPGNYTGRYFINGVGGPYFGVQSVSLAAGTYYLDTGAEIGSSAFSFSVDSNGNVSNISPAAAATASGSTITFNNASITIQPGNYTGRYFLSIFGTAVTYSGTSGSQTVVLVPALAYTIDNGTEAGGSAFSFSLDPYGNVSTSTPAASGSGTTLSLNTVPIQINPQAYSGTYYIASFYPTALAGTQTKNLLPGLTYSLDNSSEIGGSSFVFAIDATGNVSTTSPAASAAGSVLTLANVDVEISSACSGSYYVAGYGYLSGSTNLVMIPGLAETVGSGSITPSAGLTVTVGCLTLTVTAPAYVATVQPPINSDGSSVFNANRGVVPVKFILALNGAATCQLPPATISLIETSGAAPGTINQSDYLQPSDSGTSFRISSCQYVYNLGTSALGTGQYVVQITINNAVAGTGTFGLD